MHRGRRYSRWVNLLIFLIIQKEIDEIINILSLTLVMEAGAP